MPRLSAAEAAQLIAEDQRQLNRAVIPPTLNRIRELMRDEVFPVCNVGPWAYHVERGCITLDIPAYDPKNDPDRLGYAASRPMAEIFRETKLTGGGGDTPLEYSWIEDDGRAVANDLIGVGFGMAPQNALVQYGVFVPAGKKPTPEELAAAKAQLSKYVDRLIEEARDAFDKGPEERKAVISERHLLAARLRGIDEKWVHHQHTQESVKCEMCGKFNPSGVAKCACGTILDFELYQKIEARQKRMLENGKK